MSRWDFLWQALSGRSAYSTEQPKEPQAERPPDSSVSITLLAMELSYIVNAALSLQPEGVLGTVLTRGLRQSQDGQSRDSGSSPQRNYLPDSVTQEMQSICKSCVSGDAASALVA